MNATGGLHRDAFCVPYGSCLVAVFAAQHCLTKQSAYLAISLLECVGIHLPSYAWVRVTETPGHGPHIGARGDCGGRGEVP